MSKTFDRRTALAVLGSTIAACWGAAAGLVSAAFVTTPLRRKAALVETELGPLADFGAAYRPMRVKFSANDGWYKQERTLTVYARLRPDGSPQIISGACSHLGCQIRWEEENAGFLCPCHDGRYDLDGNVVSGPPPGPLEQFQAEVKDDKLFIRHSG